MFLAKSWLVPQIRSAFGSESELAEALQNAGVPNSSDHVHILSMLSIFISLLKEHEDEGCNFLTRKVRRGTWEMMLRAMATASDIGHALGVFKSVVDIFELPLEIALEIKGELLFVRLNIKDKRDNDSNAYDMGLSRLIFAALCWYSGKQIIISELFLHRNFFEHNNLSRTGEPIQPMETTNFKLIAGDRLGFAIDRRYLFTPPAIANVDNAMVDTFKWFGILDATESGNMPLDDIDLEHDVREFLGPSLVGIEGMDAEPYNKLSFLEPKVGSVPNGHHDKIALLRAKILLTTTDKSVAEISYELGYESDSVFRRRFVKEFGEPPSKYKEKTSNSSFVGSDHILDSVLSILDTR